MSNSIRQNRDQELASKVTALKQISVDINQHVTESNLLMDDMYQNMGSVEGMFSQANIKLRRLMRHGGMKLYCYLAMFVTFVIFLLVLIVKYFKS